MSFLFFFGIHSNHQFKFNFLFILYYTQTRLVLYVKFNEINIIIYRHLLIMLSDDELHINKRMYWLHQCQKKKQKSMLLFIILVIVWIDTSFAYTYICVDVWWLINYYFFFYEINAFAVVWTWMGATLLTYWLHDMGSVWSAFFFVVALLYCDVRILIKCGIQVTQMFYRKSDTRDNVCRNVTLHQMIRLKIVCKNH